MNANSAGLVEKFEDYETPSDNLESHSGQSEDQVEVNDDDADNGECWSNRTKAIVFMNGYCLTLVIYQSMAKVCTNAGVNVFDLCFIRTFINLCTSTMTCFCFGKGHFDFTSEQAPPLVIRSFLGLVTYTTLLVGVMLMPIFLANIILNTAPFWTALLAYCILGEGVKTMEIICMVGCFVGVIVLATAPVDGAAKTLFKNGTVNATGKHMTVATHEWYHMNVTGTMHKLGLDKYQSNEKGYLTGLGCMMVAAWS